MKPHLFALGFILTAAALLPAQEPAQVFTRPVVPSREALERLHLQLAWRVYVPMAGLRDGIHSVLPIGDQVLVQTRGGTITAYDLQTGAVQWRNLVGEPFSVTQPLQAEGQYVYAVSRAKRQALKRATGQPPPPGEPVPIPFAGLVGIGEEPVAFHGDMLYTVRADQGLTAQSMDFGYLLWRVSLSGRVVRRPFVTDDDIFVAAEGNGLFRIDRFTGETIWTNAEATRFVAVNPKFVYATDRSGRLLVLDYARGTRLSIFDTREFVVPIGNDITDRLLLASHDGLLVCLHDRSYRAPLRNKTEDPQGKAARSRAGDRPSPDVKVTPKDGEKMMPEK